MSGPLGPPAPHGASMSMPIVARRPWRLIIVVLVIDIALAAAGAWLLAQGLGAKSSAVPPAPHPAASTTP